MDALELKPKLDDLAADGIYVGTSSWKYTGWIGQLYDEHGPEPRNGQVVAALIDGKSTLKTFLILSAAILWRYSVMWLGIRIARLNAWVSLWVKKWLFADSSSNNEPIIK